MSFNRKKYFVNEEPKKTVEFLESKASQWFTHLVNDAHFDKIKASYDAYYGRYYNNNHQIGFSGEQGELVNIAVNHYRNIGEHTVRMITANRPSFQARSTNTDSKSQIQTQLANGLLEYYMREKKLERHLRAAVESAVILSAGYIKMEWDNARGQVYDYIEQTTTDPLTGEEIPELDEDGVEKEPIPIYEGDVKFSNLTPFDVVFDDTRDSANDHDWLLVRTKKNKFDLVEQFPELEEQILKADEAETYSSKKTTRLLFGHFDETYDIFVYEFYHRRTPAVPNGKYLVYVNSDTVLINSGLPYRDIPVYRITPSDVMGTPFGYTIMFDLLQIQEALNSVHSAVMTNISAHAVSNIINPRGNGITVNQIEGGMNFIEYEQGLNGGGRPEVLDLLNTPIEVYNYMEKLEKTMEIISAINSVVRGDPQASLKSGTSLALVQSQALQFISSLQQSYIQLIEDTGTGLINLLRDFASVPRVAAISGISNRTKMRQFTGDDISEVNRVIVDAGNALAQTAAGRTQIAQDLIQMGLIKSPEQYLQVLNTGKLEVMTEGQTDESVLVKDENERLINNDGPVTALAYDDHQLHLKVHRCILADSILRHDPDLVARVLAHIQEHIDLLQITDPYILTLFGQQPPPPPMMPGMDPNAPQGEQMPLPPMPQGQEMSPEAQGLGIQPPMPAEMPLPATEVMGLPTTAQDLPLVS